MRRAKQPNPATPPTDIARLEHVPLGQLRGWPRNPKQHDLLSIRRSYDRFGLVLPLVEDATSTQLVAGHVGNQKRQHPRRMAGRSQTAALDG